MAPVQLGGKWGYINYNNEMVIEPSFERVLGFSKKNLSSVQVNDKWGAIDTTGQLVIEPQFEELSCLNNKPNIAKRKGKFGIVDDQGNALTKFIYDHIDLIYGPNPRVQIGDL